MKALLANHRYYPYRGGSEIYTQKLAEWLAGQGWQVTVITTCAFDLEHFWDSRARAVDAPARERINDVDVVRLPVHHRPGGKYLFGLVRRSMGEASRVVPWPAPFRIASRFLPHLPDLRDTLLDGEVPDLIVATNLGIEGLAVEAKAAARRLGVPFVLLPFAHTGDESSDVPRRYVSMPHHRKLLRDADLTLTMTRLEAEFAVDCGANEMRVEVVGAGVHLNEVIGGNSRHFELLFGKEAYVVGALGALAADKGSTQLVEASKLLRDRGVPIEVVLAGPELSAFAAWFERRGATAWPWVHRPGMIDDEAKRDMLTGIDVLALPSRTESFGIVFLEAWTNRKPVVGAAVGALNEIIEDGADGLLVPFGDVGALATALERLYTSPTLRCRLGKAGRAKVEAHYTWERVLARIGEAFERVLGVRVDRGGVLRTDERLGS